jgi:ribosomal RNA-processing protein 9
VDREIISQRLQEDVAETKGKVYKHIALSLSLKLDRRTIQTKNPVTSVVQYGKNVFLGCKNGVIEKWDVSEGKPVRQEQVRRVRDKKDFRGHLDDVLCLAMSGDGKVVASGGMDKRICVWETEGMHHLKTFTQHRGPVMVLPRPLSYPAVTRLQPTSLSFIVVLTLF